MEGNVLRVVLMGRCLHLLEKAFGPGNLITTINSGSFIDETWRPKLRKEGMFRPGSSPRKVGSISGA